MDPRSRIPIQLKSIPWPNPSDCASFSNPIASVWRDYTSARNLKIKDLSGLSFCENSYKAASVNLQLIDCHLPSNSKRFLYSIFSSLKYPFITHMFGFILVHITSIFYLEQKRNFIQCTMCVFMCVLTANGEINCKIRQRNFHRTAASSRRAKLAKNK